MADRYEERAREIVRAWGGKPGASMVENIASALRDQDRWPAAVPIGDWTPVPDQRVLLFVVHSQARFAKTDEERAMWQGWCAGYWTGFFKGGWIWSGHIGEITHVCPLPPPPTTGRERG